MPSEYRHMSSGSLNIPPPTSLNGNGGGPPPVGGMGRFDGPRSPPGRQNTSHVPCKFFRQGACQAGSACPFSHDLASTTDNVCKYFAKGNCKFGPKCANVHVLPDGRRVNYKSGAPMAAGQLNIGGRLNTDLYHQQSSGSALTKGFIRANAGPVSPYGQQYSPFANQDESYPPLPRQSIDINVPTIDTSYASHTTSNYGSPRDDDATRFGLGLSPVAAKGLSVLDAPLPASFDSNGVSWIARHGPMASSVPAKFGIESPPSSVGAAKEGRTSEALKSLHSSAFGDDTRDRFNGAAASPPVSAGEEYYGKRIMHSHRFSKAKVMSSSLPKAVDQDWEQSFTFEEDYLPETLRDLMTPQEKARRESRCNADEEGRPIPSGSGTPSNDPSSKFGSPANSSPSRWGPLFQRHQQQKEDEDRAAASRASAFGHVGSPLRNSTLHQGASPNSRSTTRAASSTDTSSYLASPPRQSSMSIISQQLQRTRLSRAESSGSESGLHPSRVVNNPLGSSRAGLSVDRQISSGSINGSGRFTTPIDEENADFVFNMEGMDEVDERKGEKRNSGGWPYPTRSPHLGPAVGAPSNGNSSTGMGMFGTR
ncbi:hypothetical protein BJ875DRAFT_446249 [Amylocarpus encephaloides]|uniref:C3H1-type domain-containing protein n=1 Tax=Amylocarpus encephaloides TaxID=45428 RepID=A0A9P8C1H2_9HELO|nr:hypothetical protein BJ875DRAFT_446249 [Amylocarpus encephaloides]